MDKIVILTQKKQNYGYGYIEKQYSFTLLTAKNLNGSF